jgi:hypothetical protein
MGLYFIPFLEYKLCAKVNNFLDFYLRVLQHFVFIVFKTHAAKEKSEDIIFKQKNAESVHNKQGSHAQIYVHKRDAQRLINPSSVF